MADDDQDQVSEAGDAAHPVSAKKAWSAPTLTVVSVNDVTGGTTTFTHVDGSNFFS